MAVVQVFCFWFSVRLGSIIVGCLTLVQSCVWLSACVLWMEKPEENSGQVDLLEDVSSSDSILRSIAESKRCLTLLAGFFGALAFACVLAIAGSFKCKPVLLYPFVVTYLLYIAYLLAGHVLLMITLKNEDYGLGSLIMYSNLGGFIILLLLYTWVCVVSLVQIILELRFELDQRSLISGKHEVRGELIGKRQAHKSCFH